MKENLKIYKKITTFFKPYKKYFFVLALMLLIGFIFAIGYPIILTKVISNITELNLDTALIFLIISLFFHIGIHLFHGSYEVINRTLSKKVELDVRNQMLKAVNNTKLSVLDKVNSGIIINRISNDASSMFKDLIDFMSSISSIIIALGYLIYIAFISWIFFFFYVCMTILLIVLDFTRIHYEYKMNKKISQFNDEASSIYSEIVRGCRDVKCMNIKEDIQLLADKKIEKPMELKKKTNVKLVYINRSIGILRCVMYFMVFLIGILLMKNNAIDLAAFVISYTYFDRVQQFSDYMQDFKQGLSKVRLSGERIFEIIDDFPKESFGENTLLNPTGFVCLKDINFAYDKESVLKNISMNFEPNTITAIVGKSGCGKSTILNILNYLYTSYSGEILIDNCDIRKLNENSIRNCIGIVNQNPYLFNLSLRENMKLVKQDASDEEIWKVLERVHIAKDVRKLEYQLDTVIGENGTTLSGGQRQRIAIARTLLKNPKVIVLDEATSALDNSTQSAIVDDIESLKQDHTIIIIAHRLSTIKNADKIYVLEKGKVCGEGTHEELMESNEIYNKLYHNE